MSARKKIAVLVSSNLMPGHPDQREDIFELEEEIGKLRPAFAALDMDLGLVEWRKAPDVVSEYDAMLPLLVWDYFEQNEQDFFTAMARVCQKTQLFNRFEVLKWNADKSYLEDLSNEGAPTIQTITVERASESQIKSAMEKLGAETVVIKPVVGGGAWRQVLYNQHDPFPAKDELPPEGALVQPFLKSVQEEGEYSFLYFGGQFSHALVKRPKSGDYRVQSIYGGREETYVPTKEERAQARAVLDVLEYTPLYARVDLIRHDSGQLLLIELEMIEPYLYLSHSHGVGAENEGARRLAQALHKKLSA